MKKLRSYFELPDHTASDIAGQLGAKAERLQRRLAEIRHTLAVVSGKGGVGKSLITANLAAQLARERLSVGVLDADLNGPSMARLLGAPRAPLKVREDSVEPATGAGGVKVMSTALLLAAENAPLQWTGPGKDSFIWRGTLEANTLREFLSDTAWGELDYLILDLPPGTDSLAPVHDLLPALGGAVVVTVPSELSTYIVSKSLSMARTLSIPVIGFVENMSGYLCPHCGEIGGLFEPVGDAPFEGVPRLAKVPFDPRMGRDTEAGRPGAIERPDSDAALAIRELATAVRKYFEDEGV